MDQAILEWLGGDDVGESSKALALTALGKMPRSPAYPSDGSDFGRCYRLLKLLSQDLANSILETMRKDGGEVWAALVPRWKEIEGAYLADNEKLARGDKKNLRCYDLMKSIIHPIEDASGNVFRFGNGTSLHFGRGAHK